jgi:hypothetical protein
MCTIEFPQKQQPFTAEQRGVRGEEQELGENGDSRFVIRYSLIVIGEWDRQLE